MRPPAPCDVNQRQMTVSGTFRKKKRGTIKNETPRAAIRNIRYRRTEVRVRGSTRSIARFIRGERPPARAVSRTVLSTREFGAKQIIRGKDASRFGHGKRE